MKRTALLVGVIVLSGCAGKQKTQTQTAATVPDTALATTEIDSQALRVALVLFADQASAQVAGTTTEIATRTTDPRVREQTVLFKMRTIPIMYGIVQHPDPRAAYLQAWIFTLRMRGYLTDGLGREIFGDQTKLIVETARGLEKDIVEIGYRYFPTEVMDQVSDKIAAIAADNPVVNLQGGVAPIPLVSSQQERGAVDSILGAPVRGLEGVGSTPEAIQIATQSLENMMLLMQRMPQYIRWQVELFMLEVQSQEIVVQARQDSDRISRSIESIAQTVDALPDDLRKEIHAALDEARQTIETLDTALDKAETITADVKEATANIRETVDTVNTIVAAVVPAPSPGSTPAPETAEGEPFNMKDLVTTTEQLHATTVELRGLVNDLESGAAKDLLAEVNATSTATIDNVVTQANAIVDRITWRGIYLIGGLVLGLVIYRVVAVRLIGSPPR
jgi:hypothetical protein